MHRPIQSSWLAARRSADSQARMAALGMIRALAAHLSRCEAPGQDGLSVLDLGAGTGANQEWLAPQLHEAMGGPGVRQHWHLLDHDPALLDAVVTTPHPWLTSTRHTGTVMELVDHLTVLPRPRLVTCSALLDLLTPSQVEAMVAATVAEADAALWSLSVTGAISIDPPHPDDGLVAEAFNDDQQRGESEDEPEESRCGPTGWAAAVSAFARLGWRTQTRATPWHLDAAHAALTTRLLTERVGAARATRDGPSAERIDRWLAARLGELEGDGLHVTVQHADLAAVPPSAISVQMSSPS